MNRCMNDTRPTARRSGPLGGLWDWRPSYHRHGCPCQRGGQRSQRLVAGTAILAAALCSLGGCATVVRGTNDALQVNSTPSGASVTTTNGYSCPETPCAIKMPRRSEFTATITKQGFAPVHVAVTNRVSGGGGAAMAGNLVLGGIVGAGVDAGTGAMLDLTPNPVNVTLQPLVVLHHG
jgi:hypothetical protein